MSRLQHLVRRETRVGRTGIRHGQCEGPVVSKVAMEFILEFTTPNGFTSSAVAKRISLPKEYQRETRVTAGTFIPETLVQIEIKSFYNLFTCV